MTGWLINERWRGRLVIRINVDSENQDYFADTYNYLADKLLTANELEVSLRINVDSSNMNEALKLLDILEDNNLKDIAIHLGHVSADTAGCKSIENSCTTACLMKYEY